MTFFKNKHLITAMIVTPVLAFLSYYFVDLIVKEKPQVAVAGQNYKLVAKSNCRYTSGECDLVNGEFKSTLTVDEDGHNKTLRLTSNYPLNGVTVGFVDGDKEDQPVSMSANGNQALSWSMPLTTKIDETTQLRVAISAKDSYYFAQTTLGFIEYKTSFGKTF